MSEVGFSESSFLKKLFPLLSTNESLIVPPGDDCAVIRCGDRHVVIGVDQVIEEKHYLRSTPASMSGRKLLARNLSDLAAMGCAPAYALVAMAAGPDKDEQWLLDFHRGILAEAQKHGVLLIGGDLAQTPSDTLASLTIIGELSVDQEPALRSGASEGDLFYATGSFGFSFETEHHLCFDVRLKEGCWLRDRVSAMMDVTDGLLIDASRVAKASGLQLELDLEAIKPREFDGVSASLKRCLTDGEDYELIFALSEQQEKKLQQDWPFSTELTRLGRFHRGVAGNVTSTDGRDLQELYGSGYDHFT